MRIKSVNLIGFGHFENKEIRFNEDFSVLYGPNEAGKTTIVDAIAGVLYGFKGRREELKQLRHRYKPWPVQIPYKAGITVYLQGPGTLYLERDFSTNKVEVFYVNEKGKSLSGMSAEEIVNKYLGIGTLQLYKSTMLVRQEEVSILAQEEIAHALSAQMINTGSGVSIRSVFKSLGKAYLDLSRGLTRSTGNDGPIKKCLDEIKGLEAELTTINEVSSDYGNLINRAEIVEDILFNNKARLDEISPLLANYLVYRELQKKRDEIFERQSDIQVRLDRAAKRMAELKKIESYLQDKQNFEQYLTDDVMRRVNAQNAEVNNLAGKINFNRKTLDHFNNLKDTLQKDLEHELLQTDTIYGCKFSLDNLMEAERLSGQIFELEREMAERKNDVLPAKAPGNKRSRKYYMLLIGLLLFLSFIPAVLINNLQGYAVALFVFLAGSAILYLSGEKERGKEQASLGNLVSVERDRMGTIIGNYRKMLINLTGNLDMEQYRMKVHSLEESNKKIFALKKQIEEINLEKYEIEEIKLQDEFDRVNNELNKLLEKVGVTSVDDYKQFYQTYWDVRKEYNILKESLREYLGLSDEEDLREEMSVLAVKIHNLQTQMDSVRCDLDYGEFESLSQEKQVTEEESEALEKELIKIKTGIADFERFALNGRDSWTIENQLRDKRAELKTLEIKRKGIREAVVMLHESITEAQNDMIPKVKQRASDIINGITGGRHQRLELTLDATGLEVKSVVTEGQYSVEAGSLSTGTRDQIYLALRVAMAEFITGWKKCPLIFDDPFVNFDDERLNNTISFLKNLTEEHQVIFMTKDPQYCEHYPKIAPNLPG